MEYIETGMTPALEKRLGMARQALHAYSLAFAHPESGEPCDVRAVMPADMSALWLGYGGQPVMPATFQACVA